MSGQGRMSRADRDAVMVVIVVDMMALSLIFGMLWLVFG